MNKIIKIILLTSTLGLNNPAISDDLPQTQHNTETTLNRINITKTLTLGMDDPEILNIRDKLDEKSFLSYENNTTYNNELFEAIKKFQQSVNLKNDGVIGKQTAFNLNLSEAEKNNLRNEYTSAIQNIYSEVNNKKIDKFVIVNIPAFTLTAFQTNKDKPDQPNEILKSKVIVGKTKSQTPIKNLTILSIKYNPTWSPTINMIKKELIPALTNNDANYFNKHPLKFIDPKTSETYKWNDVDKDKVKKNKYIIIQNAGNDNPLGKLKFETLDKNNIYLHDTNSRNTYKKTTRNHSSGCIRVEKYTELAAFVSNQNNGDIIKKIQTKKTFWEKTQIVPVFVIYSLVNYDNTIETFHPDIYNLKTIQ